MKPALRGTCRVSMAIRPPRLCRILDISCIQLCLQNEAQYFETQTCIASTLAQPQHSKLDMTMLTQTRMPALAGTGRPSVWVPARNPVARSNKLLARAADGPKETSTGGDSYSVRFRMPSSMSRKLDIYRKSCCVLLSRHSQIAG